MIFLDRHKAVCTKPSAAADSRGGETATHRTAGTAAPRGTAARPTAATAQYAAAGHHLQATAQQILCRGKLICTLRLYSILV